MIDDQIHHRVVPITEGFEDWIAGSLAQCRDERTIAEPDGIHQTVGKRLPKHLQHAWQRDMLLHMFDQPRITGVAIVPSELR